MQRVSASLHDQVRSLTEQVKGFETRLDAQQDKLLRSSLYLEAVLAKQQNPAAGQTLATVNGTVGKRLVGSTTLHTPQTLDTVEEISQLRVVLCGVYDDVQHLKKQWTKGLQIAPPVHAASVPEVGSERNPPSISSDEKLSLRKECMDLTRSLRKEFMNECRSIRSQLSLLEKRVDLESTANEDLQKAKLQDAFPRVDLESTVNEDLQKVKLQEAPELESDEQQAFDQPVQPEPIDLEDKAVKQPTERSDLFEPETEFVKQAEFGDEDDFVQHSFVEYPYGNAHGAEGESAQESGKSQEDDQEPTVYSANTMDPNENIAEYTFDESVWDISLFIGLKPMGKGGSCFTFLLLMINIALQQVYALIIADVFTNTHYGKDTVQGFEKFRFGFAHDWRYLDNTMYSSLAARICGADASVELGYEQMQAFREINLYLPDETYGSEPRLFGRLQGQIMCIISLLLWSLSVAKELRRLLDTCTAFRHLFQHRGGRTSKFALRNGVWHIESLCMRRVVIGIGVASLRAYLALFLMVSGLKYLIHTIDLRDLVLNALALQCVLDIDEIIFAALAPLPVKFFVDSLEPIFLPAFRPLAGCDFPSGCTACFILATILTVTPIWLIPEVHNLEDARFALCGGNKDFVIAQTRFPPNIMWAASEPWQFHEELVNYDQKVAQRIALADSVKDTPLEIKSATITGGHWSLSSMATMTGEKAGAFFNSRCQDLFDSSTLPYSIKTLVRGRLRDSLKITVKSCQDAVVMSHCYMDTRLGTTFRHLCPVKCGCDSPLSPQIVTHPGSGCPTTCITTDKYKWALISASCTQPDRDDMIKLPSWIDMARRIGRAGVEAKWTPGPIALAKRLEKLMLAKGCDAIPKFLNVTGIDLCDVRDTSWPLKKLRFECPEACECRSRGIRDREKCPLSCFRR